MRATCSGALTARPGGWAWAGLGGVLAAIAGLGQAEEIAPFRLMSIDGYAITRYAQDESLTGQGLPGSPPRARQGQGDFRTDVFLMTHSYVYHPNFLLLDVGAGPVFQHQWFSLEDRSTASSGAMYNLSARATFLRDKPLTGGVFFEHLNPSLTVAPGEVITQESERYGFEAGVSGALSPIPGRIAYTSTRVTGLGATRRIDDRVDQFSASASRTFGSLGASQVQYQLTHQDSVSGSLNLPIQASTSDAQGLNVDTRLQFGGTYQHDLTNLVSVNTRDYVVGGASLPDQSDQLFLLDLRSRFSPDLNTFALGHYSASTQGNLTSATRALATGVNYSPWDGLEGSLGMRADDNRTRQVALSAKSLDGSLRYQTELFSGTLQASYAFKYAQRHQEASAPTAPVVDEMLVFSGLSPVPLANPRVVAGSVVVTNASRTQRFVENIDYLVTRLGLQTRLQRLIGGQILEGEQVLVSYAYDTGGSYADAQLDQTVNADWGIGRYFNVYLRLFDSAPRITAGSPTFPLNPMSGALYGVRAEYPFRLLAPMTLGASIERENRREAITPYHREAEDVFLQTDDAFIGLGNFRVSVRRLRVFYDNAQQNVDLTGYDLRAWSRAFFGVDLSLASAYERDQQGLLPRRRLDNSISADWRKRKLTMTANFVASRETQGDFSRSRRMFNFSVRRDF